MGNGIVREFQKEYFYSILDKVVKAPINLYHDVTPSARILGFFSEDVTAIDGGFFFRALWIFVMQSAMVATTFNSVRSMPVLAPVYLYGFFAGKYLKDMR